VRLFGPFPVTVVERPGGRPDWAGDTIKMWTDLSADHGDLVVAPDKAVTDRLDGLTDVQLRAAGELGADVRLWRLARRWAGTKRSDKEADEYFGKLREIAVGLPADDPRRAAVELFQVAAQIVRGRDAEALTAGLGSSNPDVAVFVGLWLEHRLRKR
jgi:hypothetical protein